MSHTFQSRTLRIVVASTFATIALTGTVWASRSGDLQQKINDLAARAGQYEAQGSQAENAGDRSAACTAYRNAADSWREAASAGTSLIIETLNDSNLDGDAVNENVHIMANNAEVDDQNAARVCN
ncbi:MAG: hypothetical protein ABL973_03805 [Micropepsaceae bacterium]